ncbi:hypothetical protein GE118_02335 [Mycoplasma sp. NEAQ87857]|uniref:hypothetical protein n=1 Tax=Mycoplasma sp. NEAQ87857 TaxID=2683967 RepID=UPI0013177E78|nr:hypothetical protein [Mycoplasma sp. NEAQ87857]QGZ97632.1 hypothetical protein GE118_02335 [Mycoplasma sp. NEAQ87857]
MNLKKYLLLSLTTIAPLASVAAIACSNTKNDKPEQPGAGNQGSQTPGSGNSGNQGSQTPGSGNSGNQGSQTPGSGNQESGNSNNQGSQTPGSGNQESGSSNNQGSGAGDQTQVTEEQKNALLEKVATFKQKVTSKVDELLQSSDAQKLESNPAFAALKTHLETSKTIPANLETEAQNITTTAQLNQVKTQLTQAEAAFDQSIELLKETFKTLVEALPGVDNAQEATLSLENNFTTKATALASVEKAVNFVNELFKYMKEQNASSSFTFTAAGTAHSYTKEQLIEKYMPTLDVFKEGGTHGTTPETALNGLLTKLNGIKTKIQAVAEGSWDDSKEEMQGLFLDFFENNLNGTFAEQ